MLKHRAVRVEIARMFRVLMCVVCVVGATPLVAAISQSAWGERTACAEVAVVVTAGNPATIVVDRKLNPDSSMLRASYLTLKLEVLSSDPTVPYALELSLTCGNECVDASKQFHGALEIGQVNLFPAPEPGEERTIEIAISDTEIPAMLNRLKIDLKPILVGRKSEEVALRINSARLHNVQAGR